MKVHIEFVQIFQLLIGIDKMEKNKVMKSDTNTVDEKECALKTIMRQMIGNKDELESIRLDIRNLADSLYGNAVEENKLSDDKPGEPSTFFLETQETFDVTRCKIENIKANLKILMNESEYE